MLSQSGAVVVSVMMPAFNAEHYIGPAIESVLAQTYPDWELIVVDDGSTDGTAEILARYQDSRIRVFRRTNGGESVARNAALRRVRGEYLAFLDADDLYLPTHLEATVGYLQAHPERGGVYTDGYYCNQDGARLKPLSSRRRGTYEGDIFEQVVRSSDVFGAPVCVVLRTAIVAEHQLAFDTKIVIGPDWDFLTRYAEVASFGAIAQPTCLYRVHDTNVSIRTETRERTLSLARCRENAIKMSRFDACSPATRAFVFYDLLINLLREYPERQAAVTASPAFRALPKEEQGHLFRLMASKAVLQGQRAAPVRKWLRMAESLDPADRRARTLHTLHMISPPLCRALLGIRALARPERPSASPFADLYEDGRGARAGHAT